MSKRLRVLIVDDSENDALLLLRGLRKGGFEPEFERVETSEAMAAALAARPWDIIISDYSMPHFSGLEALRFLKQSGLDLPFILVSGTIGENLAVEAMKAGAHDYVMKGNLQRLTTAIERELREVEVRKERNQAGEWLKYLARYDPLTDLPNRNLLYERLEEEIISHRRDRKSLALMLMDLDAFKEINDTMGHQTGDVLLQEVGRRLQGTLGKNNTVARLGGDEFGVLLPGITEESASLGAAKLLKALEPPFVIGELTMDVRASIGVAFFPKHGEDKDTLFRRADVAMYLAKQSTNSYTIYSPERDSYSPERLALMAELHRAIDKNQLFLAYQPKIDLVTGTIIGVEALARWQHPKLGLIPPDQFIPMAERTGFIKLLTAWGLQVALSQSHAWLQQRLDIPVSVNLSTRILHDGHFPDQVAQLLDSHGIGPEQLELEITESVIMADPAYALDILSRISGMGVVLSIDDFGTGYSSLAYLKKLPVNAVKIDKSFVLHMIKDQNDAQIVRSTIELAHNLGLKVIAEGVENREVWDRLLALGCDEAQGYYMGRPLPAPEMTRWLLDSPWGIKGSNSGLGQTLASLTVDDDRNL
jgi:diguanylate cyclase (GGDEF)-like protein